MPGSTEAYADKRQVSVTPQKAFVQKIETDIPNR